VGATINGRYVVRKVLGEGGMGVVYRVDDPLHPDRPVALKTILAQMLDEDRLGMFKAEFETMAQLRHPNIASVYDFEAAADSDDYLFTLEFVPGRDIYEATREGEWRRIVDLLVQVCRALAYMHSREVVHFDLKPGNVLVTDDGQVKVLDFGLAGARARAGSGRAFGTPSYMAPELAMGGDVDHRADLYCLGIMAYQLLTGRLPFEGDSVVTLAFHHCYTDLEFDEENLAALPVWLRAVVERLCAKEPADRFRTANDVIVAISREGGLDYELDTDETRESYILSSRFVGRETELTRINDFVGGRRKGLGQLPPMLLIGGQSGIGKSRLMREVRYRAQLARHSYVQTDCYEGVASEFAPLNAALEHVVRLAEASGQLMLLEEYGGALGTLDPSLAETLTLKDVAFHASPERQRARMLEQVAEFLVRVADAHPYILYLNDLHWARAGTVDVLVHVVRQVSIRESRGEPVRVAVLGSFRDDEAAGRPLETLLENLAKREGSRIRLTALGAKQVSRLLGSMLGLEGIPAAFAERVFAETAGNPFFVEEVMRSLVENGSVFIERGQWAASEEIVDLDIPASVTNVFQRRLERLDVAARRVIEVMAVQGRPAPVRVLTATCGLDRFELYGAINELDHRQMVLRQPGEELAYHITHDRIREQIYDDLADEHRRGLHGDIALAIEEQYPETLDDHLYALADHTWHAGRLDKAAGYCQAAGDRAKDAYENQLAVEFFRRSLEMLPDGETELRRDLTEKLADLYLLTGHYDECLACCSEVADSTEDQLVLARLERKVGRVHWQTGDMDKLIAQEWNAVELLGGRRVRGNLGFAAGLVWNLTIHLLHRAFPRAIRTESDPERAGRTLELSAAYLGLTDGYFVTDAAYMLLCVLRATNLAERVRSSKELVECYCNVGFLYLMLTMYDTGTRILDRAVDIAQELETPFHEAYALTQRAYCHLFTGEYEAGAALALRARKSFLVRGDEALLVWAHGCHFYTLMYQGKVEAAAHCAAEAIETLQVIEREGSLKTASGMYTAHDWARALQGDEEVLDRLRRMIDFLQQSGELITLDLALVQAGHGLLALGRTEEALEVLERARTLKEDHRLVFDGLVWMYPLLARAILEKARRAGRPGDPAALKAARRPVRRGLRLARRYRNYRSPALLAEGLLLWGRGRHDRARALLRGHRGGAGDGCQADAGGGLLRGRTVSFRRRLGARTGQLAPGDGAHAGAGLQPQAVRGADPRTAGDRVAGHGDPFTDPSSLKPGDPPGDQVAARRSPTLASAALMAASAVSGSMFLSVSITSAGTSKPSSAITPSGSLSSRARNFGLFTARPTSSS